MNNHLRVIACYAPKGSLQTLKEVKMFSEQTQRTRIQSIGTILVALLFNMSVAAQVNILPTPGKVEALTGTHKYLPGNPVTVNRLTTTKLGTEGYELEITETEIEIRANSKAGEFYARQSLQQLVCHSGDGSLPCLRITDRPKYAWRSFMIDSGRQYQRVETIKGLIDRMAMLKMNVFHWHLTEGHGWRIEIEKYPKLTEVGAFVANGMEQQGFYTQKEIREIVRYAAEKHITVVPEIDIPGHSEAALQAYPEYTCFRKPPPSTGKFSSFLFCGGRESTVCFLTDILDEVCDLFPSEHIHIGGDEAPKNHWKKCKDCQARIKLAGIKNAHELQIDLTNRIARHLASRGRKAICWGDVVTMPGQKLEENIVIHWWNWRGHKDEALREAIRRKMKVIANTNYYTYFNFPQKHPFKGYHMDRTFDFQTCYERNPSDIQNPTPAERDALLGMGSCLWTDDNLTEEWLDLRLYPRLFAIAEQMWSTAERLPFDQFKDRVYSKRDFLAKQGIEGDWDEKH